MKNEKGKIYRGIVTLLFVFVSVISSRAQSYEKLHRRSEAQTLYINTKDSLMRFETFVTENNRAIKFNPNRIYYWYKSNDIFKTTGGGDGRLLCGDYTCFYPGNSLKEKGRFKKGLKDGSWTSWYENGKMKELTHWEEGVLEGNHVIYSSEGNIILTEKYKHGTVLVEKEQGISLRELKGRKVEQAKPDKN